MDEKDKIIQDLRRENARLIKWIEELEESLLNKVENRGSDARKDG